MDYTLEDSDDADDGDGDVEGDGEADRSRTRDGDAESTAREGGRLPEEDCARALVKTKESEVLAGTVDDDQIEYDSPNYDGGVVVSGSATNRFDAGAVTEGSEVDRDSSFHGNPNNSTTMGAQLNQESDQVEKGTAEDLDDDDYDERAVVVGITTTTTTRVTTTTIPPPLFEIDSWDFGMGLNELHKDSAAKTVKSRRRRNNHHNHHHEQQQQQQHYQHHRKSNNGGEEDEEEQEEDGGRSQKELMARERDSGEYYIRRVYNLVAKFCESIYEGALIPVK